MFENIAIIGCSGAIGNALTHKFSIAYPNASINAFSHQQQNTSLANVIYHTIDYQNEDSLKRSAAICIKDKALDMVIVATGILHQGEILPEKSLGDISAEKFHCLFQANTILPALIAKHFLPKMNKQHRCIFAALSARVGSISDNQLGGWYAYRASKAALNMIIKNIAIEMARRNQKAIIVGLHPGTVDSDLSKPFQKNVPPEKLFTPEFSAQKLCAVLENLTPEQSGKCLAWDAEEIWP